jgi:hypothetical protein
MRGRGRLSVIGAAVVAIIGTHVFLRPVSADTDLCLGQGTATTGAPFFYMGQGPPVNTGFVFNVSLGACLAKPSLVAAGTVSGWCGLASGGGVTHNGHRFAWIAIGGLLVVTGDLVGTGNIMPNALAGESCTSGADNFLLTSVVLKVHCVATKQKTTFIVPFKGGNFAIFVKVCL